MPINYSLLLLLACFSFHGLQAQKTVTGKFILTGKVIGADTGSIYLGYINADKKQINTTTQLKNGEFIFTGFINEPTCASFTMNRKFPHVDISDPNFTEFFLEPIAMNITLELNDFKQAKITGSSTQQEWERLKKKERSHQSMSENIQFILTHPDSYLSIYLLNSYSSRLPLDSLKMLYNNCSPAIKSSFDGELIKNEIQKIEWTQTGNPAPDFTTEDINGDKVTLSSFKGKSYVLLDFWASWCVPCRALNPHLKEIYQQYHANGFDIIGVSLDINKVSWSKAIQQDDIGKWWQVLAAKDLTQPPDNDDIIAKYELNGIPTEILINKEGIIVRIWSGQSKENEQELDEALKKLLIH